MLFYNNSTLYRSTGWGAVPDRVADSDDATTGAPHHSVASHENRRSAREETRSGVSFARFETTPRVGRRTYVSTVSTQNGARSRFEILLRSFLRRRLLYSISFFFFLFLFFSVLSLLAIVAKRRPWLRIASTAIDATIPLPPLDSTGHTDRTRFS